MTDDTVSEDVIVGEVVDDVTPTDIDLPADPSEAMEILLRALADTRRSEAALTNDVKRLAADFENFRKRVGREQAEIVDRAAQRLVVSLLPVLDSFDGAFATKAQTPTEEALLEGMRSTYQQLREILEREGLAMIPADPGEAFDPGVHEAVAGGVGHDLVITSEMRRGYTLGDRVLRPALVAVATQDEGVDSE